MTSSPESSSRTKLTPPTYASHSNKHLFRQLTQSIRGIPTAPDTTPKSLKLPTDKAERVSFLNQTRKSLEIHQLGFKVHYQEIY